MRCLAAFTSIRNLNDKCDFEFQSSDIASYSVLTYTDEDGYPELNGYLSYSDDASYAVRNCGKGCHVLVHLAEKANSVIEPPETPEERELSPRVSVV